MISMNISPPRAIAERKLESDAEGEGADAEEPEPEHRVGECASRRAANTTSSSAPAARQRVDERRAVQPIGWLAVGADPVRDPDHHEHEPGGEREVAGPVDRARGCGRRSRAGSGTTRSSPRGRTGRRRGRSSRQEIGARTPPRTRPMNMPLIPTTLLIPSARPRWFAGNASVRIATEFAIRKAAPIPCRMRKPISQSAPARPSHPVDGQEQRRERVDDEAEVVHPHAAEEVAEPAEADDEHARDDEEAEDHPEQVEAVPRLERVEADAAEDVRHRDQHDRAVDRREQHSERRVRQRDPFVRVRASTGNPVRRLPARYTVCIDMPRPSDSRRLARASCGSSSASSSAGCAAEYAFPIAQASVLSRLDREGAHDDERARRRRARPAAVDGADARRARGERPDRAAAPDPDDRRQVLDRAHRERPRAARRRTAGAARAGSPRRSARAEPRTSSGR